MGDDAGDARLDPPFTIGTMGDADLCEEQAEVIDDLGRGADRRACPADRIALLDGDRRREMPDPVHRRPRHALEKLPRVGRKRGDIAALSLGVERVKGEARFSRARDAGHDRERTQRDRPGDPLQVVGAGVLDKNLALALASGCAEHARGVIDRRVGQAGPSGSSMMRATLM